MKEKGKHLMMRKEEARSFYIYLKQRELTNN
jgi:hypothetical protein